MRRCAVAALASCVVLLAAACSAAEKDEPPAAGSAAPSTSAPSGDVLPFEGGDVELAPGTYTNEAFSPAFTFSLDSGWRGGHEVPDEFFDVIASDVTVGFAHPVFVTGAGDERVDVAGMDPAGVIDVLAGNPALRATPLPPTRIAGRRAPTVELAPRTDVELFGGAGGEFGAGAGQRHRVSAVDVDGTVMLVLAIAPRRPYGPAFAKAEAVVSSIET